MRVAQNVSTTRHDVNGNPRRAWLVYEMPPDLPPMLVAVMDEGFAGVPEPVKRLGKLEALTVTPGEYARLMRLPMAVPS